MFPGREEVTWLGLTQEVVLDKIQSGFKAHVPAQQLCGQVSHLTSSYSRDS